jgi:hypothetical protein
MEKSGTPARGAHQRTATQTSIPPFAFLPSQYPEPSRDVGVTSLYPLLHLVEAVGWLHELGLLREQLRTSGR